MPLNPPDPSAAPHASILIVDDDPGMLRLLERQLSNAGYQVFTAANGREALRSMLQEAPQILITDWVMPEMDGIELARRVRELGVRGFVYIILLTALGERQRLVEAFDAGADDFLTKPVDTIELLARLQAGLRVVQLESDLAGKQVALHKANAELAILNDKLDRQASTDELTGMFNRRETMRRLQELWATALRYEQPLACVVLDIDDFKKINDTHGHGVGDAVLRHVAATLTSVIRAGEPIGRLGGEEFMLVCPLAGAEEAAAAAERLRRTMAQAPFEQGGLRLTVTLSAGVAARDTVAQSPDELVRRADQALYDAKRAGRNRVCVAQGETVCSA